MNNIKQVFIKKPYGWGLRGDPHFWDELQESFQGATSNLSFDQFDLLLEKKFAEIINKNGKKLAGDMVQFESFPQSGMSGGFVSLIWWKETGLPLLKERYRELVS